MNYKAKATRNDDGSYVLSYGKGTKKLIGRLLPSSSSGVGDGWTALTSGLATAAPMFTRKLKRETVAAWGEWAANVYENEPHKIIDLPAPRSGPPIYRPPEPLNGPQYMMRTHEPNTVFEYVGGFAVIDRAAGEQVAWCKYEQEAMAILERNNAWNETSETPVPDNRSPEDPPQLGVSSEGGVDPGV